MKTDFYKLRIMRIDFSSVCELLGWRSICGNTHVDKCVEFKNTLAYARVSAFSYVTSTAFIHVHLRSIFLPFFFSLASIVFAQPKIAVLVPDKSAQSRTFAEKLEGSFSSSVKILDDSLSDAAYRVRTYEKPFNLSLREAKNIGSVVGCDYFLLIKAENQRRISLSKGEFYESYAVIFTVSARDGRLVFWKLDSFEAAKPADADKKLFDSVKSSAAEIFAEIQDAAGTESGKKAAPAFEKLPEADSPAAKSFRPPLPYKRFRPEYTPLANLYAVEATVDAELDVDETGKVLKVEIARWAGFGLDESVAENIKKMNWRPAERNGKALPMRVLLRYNFKKIDAE